MDKITKAILDNPDLMPHKIVALLKEQGVTTTRNAVKQRIYRMRKAKDRQKLSSQEADAPEQTDEEIAKEAHMETALRATARKKLDTDRKYRILQDELDRTQTALQDALHHNKYTPTITAIKSRQSKGGEATAFALLSDVHCEEVVPAHKVNYLNEHNPDISQARVARFFDLVLRFINVDRQECKVDNLVLWLGGDFFTNDMHGAPTAFPPIIAMQFAEDMIVSGITHIAEHEPNLKIHIVGSVGNHSRMNVGKPVNQPLEQELSLEWAMYHHIAKHFAGDSNISFQLDNSFHTYVEVYGKVIRFNHGHQGFRYNKGQAGLHGPLFKAIREVWDLQRKADLTCTGHYHTYTPASTLKSRNYCTNGSTIGAAPYGMHFGYEDPIQSYFLIHSSYGLVAQRPLLVAQ